MQIPVICAGFLFKNANEIEFDKNGRFIIPSVLREYAHLDGAATVIGTGEDIEIWSPELLQNRMSNLTHRISPQNLAEKFDSEYLVTTQIRLWWACSTTCLSSLPTYYNCFASGKSGVLC